MFASSWTRWGCSLGQGKRNFSGRMDVGKIISVSSCNIFCFLQSGRSNSHSGTQGRKAVSFSGKDFFSKQACLTWVWNNYPDSQRVQEQPTACPPDRAGEVAPSQIRCTGHPAWYSAFNSSKTKAISSKHVSLFCSLSAGIHKCASRNSQGTSLPSLFSVHLWAWCLCTHMSPFWICQHCLSLHLLWQQVPQIQDCSVKRYCHLLEADLLLR